MLNYQLLILNPGSTSTKIAWYSDTQAVFLKNVSHDADELAKMETIPDQMGFRFETIIKALKEENLPLEELSVVISRGGLLKPIESGVYEVDDTMITDLIESELQHASNLGAMIAKRIADEYCIKAYIADPVVVDEMEAVARYSGHPEFARKSVFHALNQKAIARQYARETGRKYDELNLIVAHMGGGISVGLHRRGKVVDVNQALDGEGAFSPERSGSLPVGDVIRACYSGKYTEKEMFSKVVGQGGLVAYCGINDVRIALKRSEEGDEDARMALNAIVYQVSKEIGALAAANFGHIDAILLTGGIAHNLSLMDKIRERVRFVAPVHVFPGEDEMRALMQNGMMLLKGEVQSVKYGDAEKG
ncbi:putative butyrate kinase (plasmid) [Fulvitalea axinellae]|uniref:Probable butyrate kinase n=1 Tax=Fulvitalea axinellae TaxID=1182444 RepID=A0AAU9D7Z1_9BACT|nr:putative butyrate kinase [Fulvitalea axinellae]